jgi:hypothetical protein
MVSQVPLNPPDQLLDGLDTEDLEGNVPSVWVVGRGGETLAHVLTADRALGDVLLGADSAAGAALRRLVDAIPAPDWHIASALRAEVQLWLSRRPVGDNLLRAVYG